MRCLCRIVVCIGCRCFVIRQKSLYCRFLFFQELGADDRNAGHQTAAVRSCGILPLFCKVKRNLQILVLHLCDCHKRLRQKADCIFILREQRHDFRRFGSVFERHIRCGQSVLPEQVLQRVIRRRPFSGQIQGLSSQILDRSDGVSRLHDIQNAKRIDVDDFYAALCPVVQDACNVCREQCDIHFPADDHCSQFIRRCHHHFLIRICLFLICHCNAERCDPHRSRAL